MESWHKVGDEAEFKEGLRLVKANGRKVVIARLEGDLFAFDAFCPHAGGPMELSECEGTVVSCPLHAWRFDLKEGGRELHGYRSLPLKPLKTENGAVYVAVQTG
jgi:nitrite reductase/ring-hydroxylating ferredoxin subunit